MATCLALDSAFRAFVVLAHALIRVDGEIRMERVSRGNAVTVTHCAFSVLAVTVLPRRAPSLTPLTYSISFRDNGGRLTERKGSLGLWRGLRWSGKGW